MKLTVNDLVVPSDSERVSAFNLRVSQAIEAAHAAFDRLSKIADTVEVTDDWEAARGRIQDARVVAYHAFRVVVALVVHDREGVFSEAVSELKSRLDAAVEAESKARSKAAGALRKAGISPATMPGAEHNPRAAQDRFDAQVANIPDVRAAAGEVAEIRNRLHQVTRCRANHPEIVRQAIAEFRALIASLV